MQRASARVCFVLAFFGVASAAADTTPDTTIDRIDRLVRDQFYLPEADVERRGWSGLVARARAALAAAGDETARVRVLGDLVRGLHTSHTEYVARSDPRYWDLAGIFEEILRQAPGRCPDRRLLPAEPITWDEIGVWWTERDGRWFVGGLYDDGAAKKAGLLLGDEAVDADGRPFAPVAAFAGRAGRPVALAIRRVAGGPLRRLTVTPRRVRPTEALKSALTASARIIERPGGARIAYVHVWAWTGEAMHEALRQAIGELNQRRPTAFILDLRDGWGGASPDFVSIFDRHVATLGWQPRGGKPVVVDAQIRVPAAVLINGGVRSGKETIVYSVKKHHLATLVGEPTAGAMVAGTPFCLPDGALLYLAAARVTVDGEDLEGKGTRPDVAVPFDVRHAAGADAQLEAAVKLLEGSRG